MGLCGFDFLNLIFYRYVYPFNSKILIAFRRKRYFSGIV